jgi:hypothetical protein
MLTPLFDTARGTDWQTLHLTLADFRASFRGRTSATYRRWPASSEKQGASPVPPRSPQGGRALKNCRP